MKLITRLPHKVNPSGRKIPMGKFECSLCTGTSIRELYGGLKSKYCSTQCATDDHFRKDTLNKKFGRLFVLCDTGRRKGSGRYRVILCYCDCGNEFLTTDFDVRRGHTQSCGCMHQDIVRNIKGKNHHSYKHGLAHTHSYREWGKLKDRTVHKTPWCNLIHDTNMLNDFAIYYNWRCAAGFTDPTERVSPHRIDNTIGYTKENIEFLPLIEHADKHRKSRAFFGCNSIGRRAPNAKLSDEQALDVYARYQVEKSSGKEIADEFGVSPRVVKAIARRETYKDVTEIILKGEL